MSKHMRQLMESVASLCETEWDNSEPDVTTDELPVIEGIYFDAVISEHYIADPGDKYREDTWYTIEYTIHDDLSRSSGRAIPDGVARNFQGLNQDSHYHEYDSKEEAIRVATETLSEVLDDWIGNQLAIEASWGYTEMGGYETFAVSSGGKVICATCCADDDVFYEINTAPTGGEYDVIRVMCSADIDDAVSCDVCGHTIDSE